MTAALVVAVASPAWATTFTVNSTADTGDASTDGTCDSCTLREALQEANANNNDPTVDVINFAIPGDGPHIISPANGLPSFAEAVTIDGYTESLGESTPASPNTLAFGTNANLRIVISGANLPAGRDGLTISGGPTTIRGLVINGFRRSGAFGGNAIVFTSTAGTGNHIEGNFIGTNAGGTAAVQNGSAGVFTSGLSTGNIIGGTTPDKRNLISGNFRGVEIFNSEGTKVQGNLIGTDKTGTADLGNGAVGISVRGDNNLISDNVIAFNDSHGVETTTVGNHIITNSIFSNGRLGIDLNPGGREQDSKDPDTGPPNNLQNYPVITSATSTGTATTVKGTLNSRPRKTFTVQFFSNPAGTDEGKTYLGQVNVRTNRKGKASFNVLGPAVSEGEEITATATNLSTGDTSEFSDKATVVAVS